MNYFKSIIKILIIFLLLMVSVGAISASDSADSIIHDSQDEFSDFDDDEDWDDDSDSDDFDDDEDWDDDSDFDDDEDWDDDSDFDDDEDWDDDSDFDDDEDWDDDSDFDDDEDWDDDSDFDDDEDWDDDSDFDDDEDWDDDSDFDDDEDWDDDSDFDDDEDWDYEFDDYEFLEYKIISYLNKFGNCTDENWTQSDDFLNEYQLFLSNSSNYTLNESLKGYQTYLKIFDSITSTFDEYNLTENQTAYLKFMIIYYLNHYGNVSENYTWNESDEFSQFFPFLASGFCFGSATSSETPQVFHKYSNLNNIFNPLLSFSDIDNVTSNGNASNFNISGEDNSGWANIIVLILVLLMVLLVFI